MSDDKISRTTSALPAEFNLSRDPGNEKPDPEKKDAPAAHARGEVQNHIDEIVILVERANARLDEENNPVRFNLRSQGDEIYIDVIRQESTGESAVIIQKNITRQDFIKAVEHLLRGGGLLLDTAG